MDPGTCYGHFRIASKKCFWPPKMSNFMHAFKSAILEKIKNCQNCTFEPVHEIWNFLGQKHSFEVFIYLACITLNRPKNGTQSENVIQIIAMWTLIFFFFFSTEVECLWRKWMSKSWIFKAKIGTKYLMFFSFCSLKTS